jgi:Papain family cysteine protease
VFQIYTGSGAFIGIALFLINTFVHLQFPKLFYICNFNLESRKILIISLKQIYMTLLRKNYFKIIFGLLTLYSQQNWAQQKTTEKIATETTFPPLLTDSSSKPLRGTGFKMSKAAYEAIPLAITSRTTKLPDSISWQIYCPPIGNQADKNTCAAWATVYSAATILFAKANGIQNPLRQQAFSPGFSYKIHHPSDPYCKADVTGEGYIRFLDSLQITGMVYWSALAGDCAESISSQCRSKAIAHRIQSYNRLFNSDATYNAKVENIKKALADGMPVPIGIQLGQKSVDNYQESTFWKPQLADPLDKTDSIIGHMVCIVGYNDKKEGGAFEIMNSWGDTALCWIKYTDLEPHLDFAFSLSIDINNILGGRLRFIQQGTPMNLKKDLEYGKARTNCVEYNVTEAYSSGTRFRLVNQVNGPAFFYILVTDNTMKINLLHPQNSFKAAFVADKIKDLPSIEVEMDKTIGTDVYCLLYSKYPLDIKNLIQQLEADLQPTFIARLQTVLKDSLVNREDIESASANNEFAAWAKNKSILAVLVKVPHR